MHQNKCQIILDDDIAKVKWKAKNIFMAHKNYMGPNLDQHLRIIDVQYPFYMTLQKWGVCFRKEKLFSNSLRYKELLSFKVSFSHQFSMLKSIKIWISTNKKAVFWNFDWFLHTGLTKKYTYKLGYPLVGLPAMI